MSTAIAPLVDRVLGGRLDEVLSEYRASGLTFEQIARAFKDDHDIDVTKETVRKWVHTRLPRAGKAAS